MPIASEHYCIVIGLDAIEISSKYDDIINVNGMTQARMIIAYRAPNI